MKIAKKIKGKAVLIAVCIIIFLTIVMVVLFGTKIQNNSNDPVKTDEVKESLSQTLNCIINNDFNNDFHYLSMYGDIKEQLIENEIPREVAKNISYEIGNVEIDKDDEGDMFALVDITFKSVDMITLLSDLEETDNYKQVIVNKLNNKEYIEKSFNI